MWGPRGTGGNPWTPPPQMMQQQQQEQWSFNPNHYTDIPHNQVDWAALAQQWIILKEANTDNAGPVPSGPPGVHLQHHHIMANLHQPPPMTMGSMNFRPPPVNAGMLMGGQGIPPGLQMNMNSHSQSGDIIGEAPMDVESHEHQDSFTNKNGNSVWNAKQTNWFAPENNNPWSGSMTASSPSTNSSGYVTPTPPVPPHIRNSITNSKKPHPPAVGAFQNFPPYQDNPPTVIQTGYETAAYAHKGGYWSTNDNSGDGPALPQYSTATAGISGYSSDENSMSDFDAAKRKALPIWIREGLEKMEREKKKKEEMVKLEAEREEMRKKRLAEEQDKIAEDEQKTVTESKWSNSRGASSEEEDSQIDEKKSDSVKDLTLAQLASKISKEDQEQAIRLAIRRASTLLLCRITDAEIYQAAHEALARAKSKKATSTMQVRKLGALASLTRGPLGLTGYGSDSEESNSSKSDHEEKGDEPDSEEELIAEIERKKRLWELKRLATERESSRSRSRSRGPSPHQDQSKGNDESHQINSHLREKREVEKPNVTDATSDSEDKPVKNLNGRRVSTDSNSRSSRRDSDAKKDKPSSSTLKEEKESSYKKRDKSRSKSPRKGRKRRSGSRESRRNRSPSSSRHRPRRSRSRSRSSSRHRGRRSRSRSVNRRRRDRSSSRNRRRNRSRSESGTRERHGKSSRKRSKSRDLKRSKSRSKDRSKNNKEDKPEKVKSKSKSDSSKEKDKHSKKRSSKSRSPSVSSSESVRRGKSHKKKHKKRSRSRSSSSSRSKTSVATKASKH